MSKYGNPEIYSRFLRNKWMKVNNTRIHPNAFQPRNHPQTEILEVSCYETQGLDVADIQKIHNDNNILLNRKPPMGHCSIPESKFPSNELSLDKNYSPDRHINFVGWEKYSSKEDRKELATQLAEEASKDIAIY